MLLQGAFSLYVMLYAWEHPDRLKKASSPQELIEPNLSFTFLLPARHEQAVIGATIQKLAHANYPKELFEVLIICEQDDVRTIQAAKNAIVQDGIKNAKIITFGSRPINKPHGLNIGLRVATKDIVTIFDSEDDVHPDLFKTINTVFVTKEVDVVQAGVQLINYDSKWFSSHNVLEYFFWFKSRMHFQTANGVTPLGGNTVFFKTDQLKAAGGWNEDCLTEDADIGIRMSTAGAKVHSIYDPRLVTKEETPDTLKAFIKQRTRWNQGFIQVLRYGNWKSYPTFAKRALAFYTLIFPIVQSFLFILTPIILFIGFTSKPPLIISLLSFIPIFIVLLQLIVSVIGLAELIREQRIRRNYWAFPLMIITFIPYQLLLGVGAIRATVREMTGTNNWEKTEHTGQHRQVNEAA